MADSCKHTEPTIQDLLDLYFLKSRVKKNSMIYGYFSGRSKNEIASRFGLSRYRMVTIVKRLIAKGFAKQMGKNLVLVSVANARQKHFQQITRNFNKNRYRYVKTSYKDFQDIGRYLILKLNKANQTFAFRKNKVDEIETKNRGRKAKYLCENLKPEVYFSVRSIACLFGVSKTKTQAILKRLVGSQFISLTERKHQVDLIPIGAFDAYCSVKDGYNFAVEKKGMLAVYLHQGTDIEFLL